LSIDTAAADIVVAIVRTTVLRRAPVAIHNRSKITADSASRVRSRIAFVKRGLPLALRFRTTTIQTFVVPLLVSVYLFA
jgi:hypothetical protein